MAAAHQPYNQQSELVILKGNTAFIFLVTQHAILSELDTIGDGAARRAVAGQSRRARSLGSPRWGLPVPGARLRRAVFLEKNVFLRESAGLSYSPVAYHSAWLIKV